MGVRADDPWVPIAKPSRQLAAANYSGGYEFAQTPFALQEAGMRPKALLRLEYFFYAAAVSSGEALARDLLAKGYSAECLPAADGSPLYCITGWTVPFAIDEATATAWTEVMCRLAYDHDCEFDGWGTDPHQPDLQN